MTTAANTSVAEAKKPDPAPRQTSGQTTNSETVDDAQRSQTAVAIATELAPAVAIALLGQSDQVAGHPAAALEPLGAGAVASEIDGNLRVQLLFENGAVLPFELSAEAAGALAKGIANEIAKELPKT